jgi:hypothetical protein
MPKPRIIARGLESVLLDTEINHEPFERGSAQTAWGLRAAGTRGQNMGMRQALLRQLTLS